MEDGIKNKDQLLSLTLRQLRQEASKLSVPLYSRKTKAVLVDLILKYQEKSTKKANTTPPESKSEETFEPDTITSSEEAKTNVGSSTDVAVSKLKSQLADAEELILPLLHKLMENEDKEYIYWPNRKAIINQQIERVKKVTRG